MSGSGPRTAGRAGLALKNDKDGLLVLTAVCLGKNLSPDLFVVAQRLGDDLKIRIVTFQIAGRCRARCLGYRTTTGGAEIFGRVSPQEHDDDGDDDGTEPEAAGGFGTAAHATPPTTAVIDVLAAFFSS